MSRIAFYYHLVIRTKGRMNTITEAHKHLLYAYMNGIVKKNGGMALRINGIPNHIHLLLKFRKSVDFSAIVHNIKLGGSYFMRQHRDKFPIFMGWGREYAAFTCSAYDQKRIIDYIEKQEEHHLGLSYEDEMRRFCRLAGIEYGNDDDAVNE